ncbi:MAG: hypothetical protein HPY53_09335 [Brevinematales bacterium]|nr:hypothetical protein [Brevinematales bacterium]
MAAGKKSFRWRYFIDKPFQLRFIARFAILILLGMILSLAMILITNLNKYTSPIFFQAKNTENMEKIVASVDSLNSLLAKLQAGDISEIVVVAMSDGYKTNELKITDKMKEAVSGLASTTLAGISGNEIDSINKNIAVLEANHSDANAMNEIRKSLDAMIAQGIYNEASNYVQAVKSDPIGAIILSINLGKSYNLFDLYLFPIVGVSILYLALIIVFGLFISHKMAGPVYRIKKTLLEAVDGNVDVTKIHFRLRKGDELKELVDALNGFIAKINKK